MDKSVHSKQYAVLLKLLVAKRSESGMTQSQIAAKLQITQSAYSKLERGELRIDVLQLRNILAEVGIQLSDFIVELERSLDPPKPGRSVRRRK
jgi:transcriptional regulator with XRE-family HTH domain